MTFWTYMLHCADRTFYVGHTDNLERRIGQHELGLVPGYTSTRRPVTLVWSEAFATRQEACEVERRIKGWGRPKKLALIRGDWQLISALAKGKEGASTSSAKSVSMFLHPHPEHLPSAPFSLEAVARQADGLLRLHYRLTGPIDLLRVPEPAAPERRDELWRHTCFEAFVRAPERTRYVEFNFSPSAEWAVYQFDLYRQRMEALRTAAPRIRADRDTYALDVKASVPRPEPEDPLRINLAAVIEESNGTKSYWALAHPPGKPDFHHPDCFVLELPPASSA